MTTNDHQAVKAFTKWLTEFPRTSLTKRHAQLGEARFQIARRYLTVKNATKFTDLSEDEQLVLCYAVGLTVPGPVVKMDIPPAYAPGSRQAVAEIPQIAQPYGAAKAKQIPSEGLTPGDHIEAKRQEMQALRLTKYAAEAQADREGDLWTVVAAYKPDSIFIVIRQGRHGGDWMAAFASQHETAHMMLEPSMMMGKIGPVRAEAIRLHTGKHTGDVTVRVITKESK